MLPRPLSSTLFPYTTLFRSDLVERALAQARDVVDPLPAALKTDERLPHRQGIDDVRSEEHTSELQSRQYLVCRLLLEKKKRVRLTTSRTEKSTRVVDSLAAS